MPLPWWKRHWRLLLSFVGLIATALGIASGAAAFLPRITVEAGEVVESLNEAPFTIKNIGLLPLKDVSPMVGICELSPIGSSGGSCNGLLGTRWNVVEWRAQWLAIDEAYTIRIDQLIGFPLESAEISIAVQYQPWIIPWTQEKQFRFIGHKERNGKYTWRARPLQM